jgi:hypothetical protein
MYISHRARGTHDYARTRKMAAIKGKLHHKENDSTMHSYLPNDSKIWTYDTKHRTEYWNVDHLNKRKFLCQSWIWTSLWDIAPFFMCFVLWTCYYLLGRCYCNYWCKTSEKKNYQEPTKIWHVMHDVSGRKRKAKGMRHETRYTDW